MRSEKVLFPGGPLDTVVILTPYFVRICGEPAAMKEMRELWRWWQEEYIPKHDKTHDEYYEYCGLHCKFSMKEAGAGYSQLLFEYDSPEAEERCKELMVEAHKQDQAWDEELTDRCKRLVDVVEWMWT